jgi:hypothetical protein
VAPAGLTARTPTKNSHLLREMKTSLNLSVEVARIVQITAKAESTQVLH